MGDTRRFAERMRLTDMTPRDDVASTGYALVNQGKEYFVLQPSETAEPFTVKLSAGTYIVEWFSVQERTSRLAPPITVERDQNLTFKLPFETAGPSVINLKNVQS